MRSEHKDGIYRVALFPGDGWATVDLWNLAKAILFWFFIGVNVSILHLGLWL